MIKTYKQWMDTMYESEQALNESAGGDVKSIFSRAAEFFKTFRLDGSKKSGTVNTEWSRTANGTTRMFRNNLDSSKLATYALGRVEKLLSRMKEDEVLEDRKGKPSESFKYTKISVGDSVMTFLTGGSGGSGEHKNASNGGFVQYDGSSSVLPLAYATSKDKKNKGLVHINDMIHEMNLKNLRNACRAILKVSWLGKDVYPRAKDVEKGFDEARLEEAQKYAKLISVFTTINGNSVGVGRIGNKDEVNMTSKDFKAGISPLSNESYGDKRKFKVTFPIYYSSIMPGAGNVITDGTVIYKTIDTKGPGSVKAYDTAIEGIDKMFDQGKNTIADGYKDKLNAIIKKTLEQFDQISSIVVTGGASYEWSGKNRDDAKNKNLAEQRAQTIKSMITSKYSNLAVSTAGAEGSIIQPDEDDSKVGEYRKVYLKINGHKTVPGEIKTTTVKELETARFKKDRIVIKQSWYEIVADIYGRGE